MEPQQPQSVGRTEFLPGAETSDQIILGQGAFLLKKTEISVESTLAEPFSDDQSSGRVSICSTVRDENRGRSLFNKFSNRQSEEQSSIHSGDWRSSDDLAKPIEPLPFGTTISIEAAQPAKALEQKLHEMKGLEQAASMKRWAGTGRPADAWGKLMKDPELWDNTGNVLVYFGYQRPQASFRIKAVLLEATNSYFLVSKLQEGSQRTARLSPSRNHALGLRGGTKYLGMAAKGRRGLPTLSEQGNPRNDNPIRHEIHFPAPDNASRFEILRHHITTRNLFALLLDKPIVGLTYYQALTDLHDRLTLYMPREVNCAQLEIGYLITHKLHNVSNDPAAAAGLLAWSENVEIRWQDGWREAFVHCVGMYTDLRSLPEARDVGHMSWTMLERSHLELQGRVEACESRISAFSFDDIWLTSASHTSLPRRSFDHLRHFLRQYYEKAYKSWPPKAAHESNDRWLTRELVQRLQSDFGSLYDYLVDRDRCWDKSAEPKLREMMDAQSSDEDISLTTRFLFYDKKYKYPHIPHPYPKLPASTSDLLEGKQSKQSIFTSKAKTTEKRVLHAYAEASNSLLVGKDTATNDLVEAFVRFEKNDLISEVNPREARKGRWIMLYGILQVLATLSVDTPYLWFKDTAYFINPRFGGNPPWRMEAEMVLEEANPTQSHCWTVSKTWKPEVRTT